MNELMINDKRVPCESDETFTESDDGELLGEGQTGGEEEQNLVELLPFVLTSPQIKYA